MTKTELKENTAKIEQILKSENYEAGFELLRTLDDPNVYKDFNLVMCFNDVVRKYDEYGSLEFLDGSLKDGYFQGASEEDITYTFELNSDNINVIINIVKKIEEIKKGKKNIIIKYNELPEFIDEYYDSNSYETFGNTFHIKGLKIDEKLYSSNDIFDSGRWDGDYSSQQYDYDDEMILADSTEREFGTMSSPSSVDWYFE